MEIKDAIGDNLFAENAAWTFQGKAENFQNHLRRSIPMYEESHFLICLISDYFIKPQSKIIDLGCSTGSLLAKLAERHKDSSIQFEGIDAEPEMIEKAKQNQHDPRVSFRAASALSLNSIPVDLILSFYTIQFVPLDERKKLYNIIYKNLKPGGAFLLFEKTEESRASFQEIFAGLYHEYKIHQGYSEKEILTKSRSLKGRLIPLTSKENRRLLRNAGFTKTTRIFKYLFFEGLLAIKERI